MKFYSIKNATLENEPFGTFGRSLDELKTLKGVINRLKVAGWEKYSIYTYTNFYDNKTFRLVYSNL
jgi:hypothetical protein